VIYQKDGDKNVLPIDAVISTLPTIVNARMLGKSIQLQYRKVNAVYLYINQPLVSDDHWIYFIDSDISINRLVEFKNMSPIDTPSERTILCAEVTQQQENMTKKVIDDLEKVNLISRSDILDTKVISENFAYPIYDQFYEKILNDAKKFFAMYKNLYMVGRAAEFRHREVDDNYEAAVDTVQ